MSATETRLPLAEAEQLASEIVELLKPATEWIAPAGSIRRRKPDVGDLEVVCVPGAGPATVDLFGAETGAGPDRVSTLAAVLIEEGRFEHRPDKNGRAAFGPRYKRLSYKGVALDLFSVLPPAQLALLFLIRTGPADFSHRLVTPTTAGGWLPPHLQVKDGQMVHRRDGEVVPLETEADVFTVCGRPYIPPEERR